MSSADEDRIDPALVAALYAAHGEELRRFLVGLLGDRQLAGDVLQSTFVRAMEAGHTSREETRKAWLFRVAYHEAMAVRRRETTGGRVVRKWSHHQETEGRASDEPLLRREAIERVQEALAGLPPEQQEVVRLRIYEELTFAQIAARLGTPLGTILGRMRAATLKLKNALTPPTEET